MAELQEILIANLTLDTYRKNNIPPLVVPKGDYGARVVRVMITEQGKAVTVKERDAVYIVAERSGDGASEAFSGKVNKDGSVTVPITQWMLDIPVYDVICHVVVTGNGYQYSTNSFLIEPQSKENPTELSEDDPRKNVVDELLAKDSAIQAELENVKQRTTSVEQLAINVEKRVTNLEQGMMSDAFETDDSVAYIKDVPTNALPYAAISKIGGMTYKEGNVLRSAPVTEVKSVGANMATLVNGNHNLEDRIDLTVNNGHIEISTAMYEDYFYDKWKPYTTLFLKAGTYNFSLQNRSLSHNENVAFEFMIRDLNTDDEIAELLFNLDRSDNTDFVIDKNKEVYIAAYVFNSTGQTVSCSFDLMISKGSGRKDFTEPVVHTLPIPAEVQALDGYGEGLNGTYYNYVSWNDDGSVTFNKATTRIELTGKESWDLGSTSDSATEYNRYVCFAYNAPFVTTKHCSHFDYLGDDVSAYNPNGEGLASGASGTSNFVLDFAFRKNGNMPTLDSWKAYLAGQYAAGVPVTVEFLGRDTETTVIDITDLISKDNLIGVEGDGDITMLNEHEYAVPSEIIYQLKGV